MGKKSNTPAKIRMPLSDAVEFARLVTMPGSLTTEEETKRKKSFLFPEFEGVAKDGKLRIIAANKTANVYMQLTYKCDVLTPGEIWCGHNGKFSEYANAMKTDGDVVIEFDRVIQLKMMDVTVKMRNISKETLQYPTAARSINEKFIMKDEPWVYKSPDGDKTLESKFRVNVADLKPIVGDGSLMDQVYYPFFVTRDNDKSVIIVQAKNEFDSIERRIAPIEANQGEFNTDYQVGVDSLLLNLSGEITIRAGHKTPMVVVSETDRYKMIVFVAPRIPDTEAVITDDMFLDDGTDSVDLTPTTTNEESGDDEEDDFI